MAKDVLQPVAADVPRPRYVVRVPPVSPELARIGEQIHEMITEPRRQIVECFSQLAEQGKLIAAAFERLPGRVKDALNTLARRGWYLIPESDLPLLWRAADLFDDGKTDAANDLLCKALDDALSELENRTAEIAPRRARIIAQAIAAHRSGSYGLSVPAFLIHADGVCKESIGVGLYEKESGEPATRTYANGFGPDSFIGALLEPLRHRHPLSARQTDALSGLNRHPILHGESTDYDTYLVSCQAATLFAYVLWMLGQRDLVVEA